MDDDELDSLVRAVSNATRRHILRLSSGGEITAGAIAAHIDLALASVSEHLKVLRKTGLVDVRRDGAHWYYRANEARIAEALLALRHDLPKPTDPIETIRSRRNDP
ncbi:MAG: metalloregulator ArsR/SmtB family transcription factor [Actinomycetota bacterium]